MKKSFSRINNTLETILEKHNLKDVYTLQSVQKRWNEIGETISANSEPIDFIVDKKRLVIKVKSEMWKNEFFQNRLHLLNKVKQHFKNFDIRSIEIT